MIDLSLETGKSGWLVAVLLALLLHVVAASLVLMNAEDADQGSARAAGAGGVEVSLGPAGSAAGGLETATAESQAENSVEPQAEPEPEPEIIPRPEPIPVAEAVGQLQLETQLPPERQADVAEDRPEASLLAASLDPVSASSPIVPGDGGKTGTTEHDQTGTGDHTAGGGLPGATTDYAATVLAWLERHKEYPRRARLRRQQGTVMLHFVVDRQGRVLAHRIHQGSGHQALDEEVLGLIKRAQPLPAMPDSIETQTLELVVPVQFFIRR